MNIAAGRCRCRCLRRQSCYVISVYAATVILLQNCLIAYHAATRGDPSDATIVTGGVDHAPTASTVPPRSAVTSSSIVVPLAVVAARPTAQQSQQQQHRPGPPLTEKEYYSRRPHKVNEFRHQSVLVPDRLCQPGAFMVILVHSSPTNLDRREAIRVTWGNAVVNGTWPDGTKLSRLYLAFVLGLHADDSVNRAVREEHARHNDIIQGDFVDNYRNMTLKSLFDLKMVETHCPGVQYLIKSDDDMIINLPYLVDILAARPLTSSFMGPYNPRSRVFRDGVWKLTSEEFPFNFYPPYESGSAYIITGDLIHELFVTAEYVPHIFVDDVYVTGILGRILGVSHVRHSGFAYWGTRTPTACDIVRRTIVTGTKMHPQRLCALWNDLRLNPKC